MTILAAEGLVARRGGRNVVEGVSLEVAGGEVVGLVGPSGSGKSTTLLLLAGLEPPDAGVVRLDGEDLAGLGEAGRQALRRQRVALVFQGYGLLSLLTARENVELPFRVARRDPAAAAEAATRWLGLLGLADADAAWLNDDRVGRALEKLFHADRASLLTELIVGVVAEFGIDTSELHNDSTSVSVHGAYRGADGTPRGGKPTTAITFGHSKDHRPDLKQLVWILTVCADGAVPMAYRLADGNTSDDPTHLPTWDHLVALLGRADFLYVADSKLACGTAMRHIDAGGGRFVTVLPRTRAEDKWFRDWAQTNQPQWTEAVRIPGTRAGEPDNVYRTFPAPLPSAEGYRIIWVHSSAKAARDAAARLADRDRMRLILPRQCRRQPSRGRRYPSHWRRGRLRHDHSGRGRLRPLRCWSVLQHRCRRRSDRERRRGSG